MIKYHYILNMEPLSIIICYSFLTIAEEYVEKSSPNAYLGKASLSLIIIV